MAESSDLNLTSNDTNLEKSYQEIVASLPTRSPIFLPTDRISLPARLAGVRRVQSIYRDKLDTIYRPKLRELREKFKGRDRCFVIGNGPSLNKTDLSVLRNEVTFAVNGFFLKCRDLDWLPTFYVVEDHLVAEDRREWINAFKGPTKLFPAYLGYCLDEAPDAIFFNHRPRVSYPDGFDFSSDAEKLTYAGCTVTFTCLQLAHYLGFKSTYLIGVDSDYELPKDVEKSESYGVGVLDMKSDDPNHFSPDYFGKGFRWHDPQVEKMVEAYKEARRVTERTDQRIYNAGIGGKLEVFERRPFRDIFPEARTPEQMEREAAHAAAERTFDSTADKTKLSNLLSQAPRLLVIDHTRIGDGTATGEVKASIIGDWPADRLQQMWLSKPNEVSLSGANTVTSHQVQPDNAIPAELSSRIADFDPDVVLYRPVPNTAALHGYAMQVIENLNAPLITWIMDDWPAAQQENPELSAKALLSDWQNLLKRSALRLSIGRDMSDALEARYGYKFEPFANGINPDDWERPRSRPPQSFKVRYAGSLSENMTAHSVARVAKAVELLAAQGLDIQFEIKTRKLWHTKAQHLFDACKSTSFITEDLSAEDYRRWIADADALIIAYNFDDESKRYIRYSIANKLPECLASGAVLLAHGPADIATLRVLDAAKCAVLVTTEEIGAIAEKLRALSLSPFMRLDLSEAAQKWVASNANIFEIRERFLNAIRGAAVSSNSPSEILEITRSQKAAVDETEVVALLLAERRGGEHTMLDVGAHVGSSAGYFDKLGWTIHCFEPDPSNRAKLVARFGKSANVTIDTRAVSDTPATGVSFFTSDESTGISGLHAFRDTHKETGSVDVTTVAEICAERALTGIDFLKIDVEGFDFSVLKGVPWGRIMPDVIECEFEDAKTVSMGHTYKDVADFLRSKGYAVYMSEWHPIIRYGIRHDWRRVVPYPGIELHENAWGNILAFKIDPGFNAVQDAFKALAKTAPPAHANGAAGKLKAAASHAPPLSASAGAITSNGASRAHAPVAEKALVPPPASPAAAARPLDPAKPAIDAKGSPALSPGAPARPGVSVAGHGRTTETRTPLPAAPPAAPKRRLERTIDIASKRAAWARDASRDIAQAVNETKPQAAEAAEPQPVHRSSVAPRLGSGKAASLRAAIAGAWSAGTVGLALAALASAGLLVGGAATAFIGILDTPANWLAALIAVLTGLGLIGLLLRVESGRRAAQELLTHTQASADTSHAETERNLSAQLVELTRTMRRELAEGVAAEARQRLAKEREFDLSIRAAASDSRNAVNKQHETLAQELRQSLADAQKIALRTADIDDRIALQIGTAVAPVRTDIEQLRTFVSARGDDVTALKQRLSSTLAAESEKVLARLEASDRRHDELRGETIELRELLSTGSQALAAFESRLPGALAAENEKVLAKFEAIDRRNDELRGETNELRELLAGGSEALAAFERRLPEALAAESGKVLARFEAIDRRNDELRGETDELRSLLAGGSEALAAFERRLPEALAAESEKVLARLEASDHRQEELQEETKELRSLLAAGSEALAAFESRLPEALAAESEKVLAKFEASDHRHEELRGDLQKLEAAQGALQAAATGQNERANKFADEVRDVVRRIGDLVAQGEQRETSNLELQQALGSLGLRAGKLETEITAIGQKTTEIESATAATQAQLHDPKMLETLLNPTRFQPFNRRLSLEHVKTLETNWLRRLSVPETQSSLGYMAHRIREIEARSHGRLATSVEDALLRCLVVKAVKSSHINILEIGTLFGIGASILYNAALALNRSAHLTLIDPLQGYYDASAVDTATKLPISPAMVQTNMQLAGVPSSNVTILERLSTDPEAVAQAAGRSYDVLIIDGDHSFAGVAADFNLYAPMVKVGGYLIFDDYNKPDWPDVKRFVDQEMPKHSWCAHVGSEWTTAIFRIVSPSPSSGGDAKGAGQ